MDRGQVVMTEATCPGLCCAAFYWPRTMTYMRKNKGRMYDGDQIAAMLIPLTPKEARERHERFGGTKGDGFRWKDRGHHFTCRNWDEETRLCRVYKDRPTMCRDFPYGKQCPHGCGVCAGVKIEDRTRIREEQMGNDWKGYVPAGRT